jgi:hypothetical protein
MLGNGAEFFCNNCQQSWVKFDIRRKRLIQALLFLASAVCIGIEAYRNPNHLTSVFIWGVMFFLALLVVSEFYDAGAQRVDDALFKRAWRLNKRRIKQLYRGVRISVFDEMTYNAMKSVKGSSRYYTG